MEGKNNVKVQNSETPNTVLNVQSNDAPENE